MDETDRYFDSVLKDEGGLVRLDDVPPVVRERLLDPIAERFHSYDRWNRGHPNTKATLPPIRLRFINNWNLNALAMPGPSSYLIGINAGSVAILASYFSRLMSYPDLLPEIGNSAGEVAPQRATGTSVDTGDGYDPHGLSGLPAAIPRCPVRRGVASFLTRWAIDFLFIHEYTHIRNGHVDYLASSRPALSMVEVVRTGLTEADGLTLQTLEMDADAGAATQIAGFIWDRRLAATRDRSNFGALDSADGVLPLCGMAIYTLFRMLWGDAGVPASPFQYSHPHPFTRQVMLLGVMCRAIELQAESPGLREAKRAVADAVGLGEAGYRRLCGPVPGLASWSREDARRLGGNYVVDLKRRWNEIRPVLAEHAYVYGLPPIEEPDGPATVPPIWHESQWRP